MELTDEQRGRIEDAVYRALEDGAAPSSVRAEVEYILNEWMESLDD